MKEKLKNILTCKNFWSSIFELLCAAILFSVGYFSGFANGLLIEDDIRDSMIVEVNDIINDNHKNEKIKIDFDKKNAYISGDTFNDTFTFKVSTYVGEFDDTETLDTYVPFYSVDYNFYINYSIKILDNNNLGFAITDTLLFMTITDLFDNSVRTYNGDLVTDVLYQSFDISKIVDFYGFPSYSRLPIFNSAYINVPVAEQYILYTYPDIVVGDYYELSFFVNNTSIFSGVDINNLNDLTSQIIVVLGLYNLFPNVDPSSAYYCLISSYDLFNYEYFSHNNLLTLFNNGGGASEEDLQNAYNDGYNEGKIDGYNERKNSVEDSEQTINSIWSILEKAITSVLNVLSFEILPGIPLYVCIAVPILLCILLWVIKVGAS